MDAQAELRVPRRWIQAKSRSIRMSGTNVASPKEREPCGDTLPILRRRSNDVPRRMGRPSTGRRGKGDRTPKGQELCEMQMLKWC